MKIYPDSFFLIFLISDDVKHFGRFGGRFLIQKVLY